MIHGSRPVLITGSDTEDDVSAPLKSFQCDCACPENGFSLQSSTEYGKSPLQCSNVYLDTLPGDHLLMFNPLNDHGVAVLNRSAFEFWESFKRPAMIGSSDSLRPIDDDGLATRMAECGLLEPVGAGLTLSHSSARKLSVWLHVTNQCNLRCQYCYIRKTSDRMDETIGIAGVDAVFRSALGGNFNAVNLKFAGGEATLNASLILKLDSYAREKADALKVGYESVILSNGVSIDDQLISECQARDIGLMISLDGIGNSHDRQRSFINGKGSFAHVKATIDKLIERDFKPFISLTVTDQNTESLPETVQFILDRSLSFNINFVRDNSCIADYEEWHLRDEKLIEALKQAFAIIESKLPPSSLLGMLVDRSNFSQPHNKTCGVGESYLVIDHQGRIAKCHMEIENSITDVYGVDPLALVKIDKTGVQNLSVDEKEGCRECEWRYWCGGGCPQQTFNVTGRYDIKSPYCHIYKAIYPQLLRLEGLRLLKFSRPS